MSEERAFASFGANLQLVHLFNHYFLNLCQMSGPMLATEDAENLLVTMLLSAMKGPYGAVSSTLRIWVLSFRVELK